MLWPVSYTHLPTSSARKYDYGELAESVEGARLLSEYTGQNLYRGFESLALRQKKMCIRDSRKPVKCCALFAWVKAAAHKFAFADSHRYDGTDHIK